MSASVLAALLALTSALLHAAWNAAVKSGTDRLTSMAMVDGTALILCALAAPFVAPPSPAAWPFLLISTVLNTVFRLLLVRAYQLGDFGQMYPLVRGVAPLAVALISTATMEQSPGILGWAGAVLISLGITSLILAGRTGTSGALGRKPILYAVGAGLAVAGYTSSDAAGVHAAHDIVGYIVYLFLLESIPMPALALARRKNAAVHYLRDNWRTGLFGGINALLSYILILCALSLSDAARIASLRESSVVLATIIGTVVFKEPFGLKRMYCAAVVASGIVLVSY